MKSKFLELILVGGIIIFVASAFAHTWTQTSAPENGSNLGLAVSPDARVICAIGSSGRPIMSTDGGQTWTTNAPVGGYSAIACSADGKTLIATLATNGINICISTNGGADWFLSGLPSSDWRAVTVSADGIRLAAAVNNGYIYNSTNAGAVWNISDAPQAFWQSMAASADGMKLIAGASDAGVYVSADGGTTWDGPTAIGTSVASSADGNRLIAGGYGGTSVFSVSTNGGADWMSTGINGSAVASSADGLRLAVLLQPSGVATSTNGGITWDTNNVPIFGYRIASSADGNKLFVTFISYLADGIWIGTNAPSAPAFRFNVANGAAHFDWPVPSSDSVLQENSDLGTTNWISLTNLPALNPTNLHQELALPVSGTGFFRLATP